MKSIKFRVKFALFLFSGLFLLSLGLNGVLFFRAKQYYWDLNGTRLDPLGLRVYPTNGVADEKEEGVMTAVFFGDSRAAQWPNPAGLDGYRFINRGIGSQTSVQVAARFQQHITPLKPDVIIVQMCINDLKTIPLFPQNETAIIHNCLANIDQILVEAEEIGATVILTTVFPVGNVPLERRLVWSPKIGEAVTAVNVQIQSKVSQNVLILNSYDLLVDDRSLLNPQFASDELHLNEAGYAALNEALVTVIAP